MDLSIALDSVSLQLNDALLTVTLQKPEVFTVLHLFFILINKFTISKRADVRCEVFVCLQSVLVLPLIVVGLFVLLSLILLLSFVFFFINVGCVICVLPSKLTLKSCYGDRLSIEKRYSREHVPRSRTLFDWNGNTHKANKKQINKISIYIVYECLGSNSDQYLPSKHSTRKQLTSYTSGWRCMFQMFFVLFFVRICWFVCLIIGNKINKIRETKQSKDLLSELNKATHRCMAKDIQT